MATVKTRFQQKRDIEANWKKAKNFVPLDGELIIYETDPAHSTPRFKVGDGVTKINDLAFFDAKNIVVFGENSSGSGWGESILSKTYTIGSLTVGPLDNLEGLEAQAANAGATTLTLQVKNQGLTLASVLYELLGQLIDNGFNGGVIEIGGQFVPTIGLERTTEGSGLSKKYFVTVTIDPNFSIEAIAAGTHPDNIYIGVAYGNRASAFGDKPLALGENSFVAGNLSRTTIGGDAAFAAGYLTSAEGVGAFAAGSSTVASGFASFAEGNSTVASGESAHAQNNGTVASGKWSTASGNVSRAIGDASFATGSDTEASGSNSYAGGYRTKASGYCSTAEGELTEASGSYSHAEGRLTIAKKDSCHAEGAGTKALWLCAHAEGFETTAESFCTHAEGCHTSARGKASHSEGDSTVASGNSAHAEGVSTEASGESAHAEGWHSVASGECSHAEGRDTIASNRFSHAGGQDSEASGEYSFAHGWGAKATDSCSVSFGALTQTPTGNDTLGAFVCGCENDTDSGALFSVGMGSHKDAIDVFGDGTSTLPQATIDAISARGDKAIPTIEWVNNKLNTSGGGLGVKTEESADTAQPYIDKIGLYAAVKDGEEDKQILLRAKQTSDSWTVPIRGTDGDIEVGLDDGKLYTGPATPKEYVDKKTENLLGKASFDETLKTDLYWDNMYFYGRANNGGLDRQGRFLAAQSANPNTVAVRGTAGNIKAVLWDGIVGSCSGDVAPKEYVDKKCQAETEKVTTLIKNVDTAKKITVHQLIENSTLELKPNALYAFLKSGKSNTVSIGLQNKSTEEFTIFNAGTDDEVKMKFGIVIIPENTLGDSDAYPPSYYGVAAIDTTTLGVTTVSSKKFTVKKSDLKTNTILAKTSGDGQFLVWEVSF